MFAFLSDAERAFTPSMRQHIDVGHLHRRGLVQLLHGADYGEPPTRLRAEMPATLDDLVTDLPDIDRLIAALRATP